MPLSCSTSRLRDLPVVLLVSLVLAACGGSTQPPPQAAGDPAPSPPSSPPPSPSPSPSPSPPAVEVVYVGTAGGQVLAFSVTEEGQVAQEGDSRIAGGDIRRLRVTPDRRQLFAGLRTQEDVEGSVFFAAVDGRGGFAGSARQVLDESGDFELAHDGRFLFSEERIFNMQSEEEIENRSVIRSYSVEGSGNLRQVSDLTLQLCEHYLCDHWADLFGATQSSAGNLLWVRFTHFSRVFPTLDFRPLQVSSSGQLQDGEDVAGHEGTSLAGDVSTRFLLSSAQEEGLPPFLFVYRLQGAQAQHVQSCNGEFIGEPPMHDLCRRVVAVALRPGESTRLFVANDGRAEVWSAALSPTGIDLNGASMITSAAAPRELKVSPSGRFLFAIAAEARTLMGFRIRDDGALEPLAGSPWPLPEQPTALTIAKAQ